MPRLTRAQCDSLAHGSLLALLAAAYACSRLWDLTLLPVNVDEALAISWGIKWQQVPRVLGSGKTLVVAAAAAVARGVDPLWALRAVSVLLGAVSASSTYVIGRQLYDRTVACAAVFTYVVCPMTLMHDRLALADTYLSAAAALTLATSIALAHGPSFRSSGAVAASLSLAVLAKIPGIVLAPTPIVAVAMLRRQGQGSAQFLSRDSAGRHLAMVYALAVATVAYPVWYFVRRTGEISSKSAAGLVTAYPELVGRNLLAALSCLWEYWTPPLFLFVTAGVLAAAFRRTAGAKLLAWSVLVPIVAITLTARIWYPRYLLFATVPAVVLAAATAAEIVRAISARLAASRAYLAAALAAALLAPVAPFDWALIRSPETAPLPRIERWQYIDGWQSGYGSRQAARYLSGVLAQHPEGIRVVVHQGSDRAPYLAFRTYLAGTHAVQFFEQDLADPKAVAGLLAGADRDARPTYIALARRDGDAPYPTEDQLRQVAVRVAVFAKPGPRDRRVVTIYRVKQTPSSQ